LLKLKVRKESSSSESVSDFCKAEIYHIKCAQRSYYSDVLDYFANPDRRCPSIVKQLNLVFMDGIIRCKGRLEHSDLTEDAKYPILLPPKDFFTKLLITNIHSKCFHSGVNYVITEMRQRWWIPRARQCVRSVLRKCVTCRRVQGKPYPKPDIPPLPRERVSEQRPFFFTGIDYTGNLTVRDGRVFAKVYICLFTCGTTRAVHLELVEDGTKEAFLRAFRRFASRRSCPSLILSDNAGIFKNTSRVLQAIFDEIKVSDFVEHRLQWKFIPARSPWWGGLYERLIGMTKNLLKKKLGKAFVTTEELRTIVTEIEALLNDRPLTYVSTDIEDLSPVTPSSLICGRRLTGVPVYHDSERYSDPSFFEGAETLNRRQQRCNLLIESFWSRWRYEYLTSLRERDRNIRGSGTRIPQVGEVVLIYQDGPRTKWEMGIVVKLYRGIDGLVRSAMLRTKLGNVCRAVCKLYPIEVESVTTGDVGNENTSTELRRSNRLASK